MSKYVVDINILQRGDIILARYPQDEMSCNIRKACGSDFSHAMLCVDYSSVIEATTDIVQAYNPIRDLYDNADDVRVYRLKPEYRDDSIVDGCVSFARMTIGTEYSLREFLRTKTMGEGDKAVLPNRQLCTRLVAQAYHAAGIDIVANPDYCTLADIENSDKLMVVENAIMEATPEIIEIAESDTTLDSQRESISSALEECRKVSGEDLQTMSQLIDYAIKHPDMSQTLVEILEQRGYFDLWKKEEQLNPHDFDVALFIKKYQNNSIEACIQNFIAIFQCKKRYEDELNLFRNIIKQREENELIDRMVLLYENLVDQCNRRYLIVSEVLIMIQNAKL